MAASIQDAIFYLDAWHSYGVLRRRTHPAEERVPTFTRSGDAYFTDSSDTLRVAGSNIIRPDYVTANDGTTYRGLTLEPSRQQLLTAPEDFSDAAWGGTATVTTDDALAPDGSQTADKIEDTSDTDAEYWIQTVSVPNDSADHIWPIYLKKKPGSEQTAVLFFSYSGGTEISYVVQVKLKDGTIQDVGTAFTGAGADATDFGVQDRGDYWRVYVAGANNGSGNTSLDCRLYPSYGTTLGSFDASDTGSVHAWGANLTLGEFPTSYIDSAATRPADSIHFTGGPAGREPLAGYMSWTHGMEGRGGLASPRLLQVSDASQSTPRLILWMIRGDGPVELQYKDSSDTISAPLASGVVPSVGDFVEAAFSVAADGSSYIVVEVNRDGALSGTDGATPNGLEKFSGRDVYLGRSPSVVRSSIVAHSLNFVHSAKVDAPLDGTDDAAFMSEMRAVKPATIKE